MGQVGHSMRIVNTQERLTQKWISARMLEKVLEVRWRSSAGNRVKQFSVHQR